MISSPSNGEVMKSKLIYLLVCVLSALIVVIFAYIQYEVVQGDDFKASHYIIPVIVGLTFGILFSRIINLSRKLKAEKDIIIEKNKRIRTFTGTIVHDLKNPITAISGLSELLLKDPKDLDERALTFLDLIQKSSTDILENITLILDKTKLEEGLVEDNLEVGNPYYTIQSAVDKFLMTAVEKNISIERSLGKDLPDVSYDKTALDHIISNLISNAIKYSPPKTLVRVYNELLTDSLKIIVKDQGLGMTQEDIDNAFQEFKTLSARPTGNETSTGLGLSIVKQLVDQMGGDITVHSDGKDQGSTFVLTLKIS